MEATQKNYCIANKILELLAKENCTVQQADEILAFVARHIRATSAVQFARMRLADTFDRID